MKEKIKAELIKIGIETKYTGFTYLADAIEIVMKHIGGDKVILGQDVYPHIAQKYYITDVQAASTISNALARSKKTKLTKTLDTIIEVMLRLGVPREQIPLQSLRSWTAEQDKIIRNNPNLSSKELLEIYKDKFDGRNRKDLNSRRHKLMHSDKNSDAHFSKYTISYDNHKRPATVKSGVYIGQELKLYGHRCKVIYIHPRDLFYQVQFTNGVIETINKHEYGRQPYIAWLCKNL